MREEVLKREKLLFFGEKFQGVLAGEAQNPGVGASHEACFLEVAVEGQHREEQQDAPYPGPDSMQDGDEEDREEDTASKEDFAGGAPAGRDFDAQEGCPLGMRLSQREQLGTGPESAVDQEVEIIPAHIGADHIAVIDEIILQVIEEGDAVPDGCLGRPFIHPEGEGFFARADIVQGSHLEVFDILEAEVRLGEAVFVARIAPVDRLQEEESGDQRARPPFGFLEFLLPGREDAGEERGRKADHGHRGEKARKSGQKRQGQGHPDVVLQTGQEKKSHHRPGGVERLEESGAENAAVDALAAQRRDRVARSVDSAFPGAGSQTVEIARMFAHEQTLGFAIAILLAQIGSDRMAAVVPDEGSRVPGDFPAFLLNPPADIDVVARTFENRVKTADFFQRPFPEGHVAAGDVLGGLVIQEDRCRSARRGHDGPSHG